ncbi:PHP domain-containing protein [Microterricola viridarii]|uniref:Metal-dependent phosphoesterase n=1 Tax=Microterricola viridarii TaxID=412690 RepID=A0A109QWH7_9MICO|nr:PHP domain-containing protein [Microterricola viridarii]AMB58005.1 metal-dependent phosphoesterase [Microterricola viridarii]
MNSRRFHGPIDLHAHSSVSDGTEAPGELVQAAAAAGLGTVALTDHDSTAGWGDAASAARATGLTLIPGMELSTRVEYSSVHLLAYLFDPADPALLAETTRIRQARMTRAEEIVEHIGRDYALSWDDVLAQAADGATIGRPHIADALVAKGFEPDRSAAFDGILHWRSGYVKPHYAPDPVTGVRLVCAAGGVPVLAHPGTRGAMNVVPEPELRRLVDAGLFGLEIDHRENLPDAKARLHVLAERYGLAVTGSSDYHGAGKPNRLGENTTAPEVLEALIAQATGSEPVYGAQG